MAAAKQLLLYENDYVHILNNDTGIVSTIIGPKRVNLLVAEDVLGL